MVLQDLGDTPPPDDFGEDPSSNNNNSYYPSGRRFDESQVPQPFPVLSRFFGYSPSVLRFRTEQTIKFAELRIHRSLTPVEAQALATHLYQMERTKSHFAAMGLSLGLVRSYMTMNTGQYPFYKPKPETIDPNKFMFVKGPYAQIARQMWRFSLFAIVGTELGKLVGQVISQPLAARDTASDPVLSQFADDLRNSGTVNPRLGPDVVGAQKKEEMEHMRNEYERNRNQRNDGELPPHAGAPRPWGRGPQPRAEPKAAPSSDLDDDMSPTASNDGWSYSNSDSFGDSTASPKTPQDDSQPSQSRRRESRNAWNRQPTRPVDQEDASPMAGFSQEETQNDSSSGGSAWERLRRGEGSTNRPQPRRTGPPHQDQRENSTLGDSFTFADSEDERRVAQEKAQREFDERIERERQGKDFNDNHKRW